VKKVIFLLLFSIASLSARCDGITFGDFLCYSAEFIYSLEKIKKHRSTISYWGGAGVVGGLGRQFPGRAFGFEIAVEGRQYFKSESFKNFFLSAYLGSSFMIESESVPRICLVPGIKMNYKIKFTDKLILEPYCGFSLPLVREISRYPDTYIYPVFTFGARFGINKLIDKRSKL